MILFSSKMKQGKGYAFQKNYEYIMNEKKIW